MACHSEDPADQNQIQSQDDPHGSQAIDISEDDIVQNEESNGITKTQSKKENVISTQFTQSLALNQQSRTPVMTHTFLVV